MTSRFSKGFPGFRNTGKTPSGEPGTTQGDKTEGEPVDETGENPSGNEPGGEPEVSDINVPLSMSKNPEPAVEGELSQDIPIADSVEIADVAQGAPVNAEPMTQGNTGCPQIVDCAKKAIEVIQNCKGASEETEVSTIPEAEGAESKGGKKKNKKKRRNTRKPKRRTKKRKSRRRISKKRKNRKH